MDNAAWRMPHLVPLSSRRGLSLGIRGRVNILRRYYYTTVSTSSVNLAASFGDLICTSPLLVNNLESVGFASFPIVIASLPFLEIESVTSLSVRYRANFFEAFLNLSKKPVFSSTLSSGFISILKSSGSRKLIFIFYFYLYYYL